jgi:hypothetical protein
MAKVNLLKSKTLFTGIQVEDIDAATKTFTCPADRAIKVISLNVKKSNTGGAAVETKVYLGTNLTDTVWDFDTSSTYDSGTEMTNGRSLDSLMPILFGEGDIFTIIGEAVSINAWIVYEEYSEDAAVTSASGFTVT